MAEEPAASNETATEEDAPGGVLGGHGVGGIVGVDGSEGEAESEEEAEEIIINCFLS